MPTRTFLALDIDGPIIRRLVQAQQQLQDVGAVVRWTEPPQIHVTVKYLGDVQDPDLPDVCAVAEQVAGGIDAFDFTVIGLSSSPPHGHMRMVWAGIEEPTGRMALLHRELDAVYSEMGVRSDNRGFHPHLTVGRVKSGRNVPELRGAISAFRDTEFGVQSSDEVVIYSSELTREGPIYTPLARVPLK